jgi:hypothetical protein
MKRILGISIALALAFSFSTAHADAKFKKADEGAYVFEPAVVASGVALTFPATGVLTTASYDAIVCTMRTSNEAGGASRLFIPKCTDRTGATTFYTYPTQTVETNKGEQFVIDPRASSVTASTDTVVAPHQLCPYLKITAAAANGITQIQCTLKSYGILAR